MKAPDKACRGTTMKSMPFLLTALLLAAPAMARVTGVRIDTVEPFAGGQTFGSTGAYERVIGVAKGELDPADPRNAGIAGLAQAKRNAAGKVEYETDIFLLRPADPAKGNRHLLFDILNRGNKVVANRMNTTTPKDDSNDPSTLAQAGDGFLYRRGYTVAWAGWDPDAPKTNHGMTLRIPALPDVEQDIRDEFVSGTRGAPMTRFRLSYAAASLDQSRATLTRRVKQGDAPEPVPSAQWMFADDRTVVLRPEGTVPAFAEIYELKYRAKTPWISGIGFAAQRDVAAFLRSGAKDSPARRIDASIVFGVSQSGRFIRDFIKFGFNQDEAGRKVFDGALSHIAGIGGVFLNAPFAQPFRTRTQHEDHAMPENAFPFSAAFSRDPVTGKNGALLHNNRFDPLTIETNTDAEYWQKGASLLGTDPEGKRDLPLPANTRLFLIAGSQHTGRYGATDAPGPCANLRNPHDPYPALRALLVALDEWIVTGHPAPNSRIPRIADGTLVPASRLRFPGLPGFATPAAPNRIDPVGDWVRPANGPSPYVALVPAVDADGNGRAGLKLPDVAAPVGTHTGFNLYKSPTISGEMCDRDGSFLPFAWDKAVGDPRKSLAERYGSPVRRAVLVAAAARALVADRLLLKEDADRYVAEAKSSVWKD
jgi:hypothetical protein